MGAVVKSKADVPYGVWGVRKQTASALKRCKWRRSLGAARFREGTGVKETGRGGANSVSLVTRHLERLEKRGRQLGHSTGHRRRCDHGQKTGT